MFKIKLTEAVVDHKGDLFSGFANINGEDLTFDSFKAALEFMVANADFFSEFTSEVVAP